MLLSHPDGAPIARVERNAVDEGLGAEEIQEFRDEIADCRPHAARDWLLGYFSRVRVIYAFQLLGGAERESGWTLLGALQDTIWREAGGIIQADHEGFTDGQGYHILWQFFESVKGTRRVGLLQNGTWVHFEMDLGNPHRREAFMAGEVPAGAVLEKG